jgi:membrane-associated protein
MLDLLSRMTDFLEGLLPSPWLWAVVLLVSALDGLLPFMPSDTTLILVGVLVAPDPLRLILLIIIAAVGCVLGDVISYVIGRYSGTAMLDRFTRDEKGQQRREWAVSQLHKHGTLLILLGRYIPAGRVATMITAGALRYPTRTFLITEVIAAAIWAAFFALLGYAGGASFQHRPALGMLMAFGTALALAALLALGRRFLAKRRAGTQAVRSLPPMRGNGLVENTTSTGTSKYSAMRNAR